jgi:hypothetical protein
MNEKKTRQKNRALAVTFADALRMVEQIHRQGGGNEVPKDSLKPIIGSKPTSSLYDRKLAALKAYGLIDVHDERVSLSSLGKAYAMPISPEAKRQATLQAFRKIPLFDGLLSRYEGKPLEINEFFHNLVAHDYEIPADDVGTWIKDFIDAARLAGILASEGGHDVVRLPDSVGAPQPKGGAPAMEIEEVQELGAELGIGPNLRIFSSGGKRIINYPSELRELEQTIDATEDVLEMMKKELKRLKGKKPEGKTLNN